MGERQLVFLQRYRAGGSDAVSRGADSRTNSTSFPSSEVLARYKGMDGIPGVPTDLGSHSLLSWPALDEALAALAGHKGEGLELLGVVRTGESWKEDIELAGCELLGFDCGVFQGLENVYSVVLHEVLFGRLARMKAHTGQLNEHYLFGALTQAQALMKCRADCANDEPGVLESFEDADEPAVFAIYRCSATAATET